MLVYLQGIKLFLMISKNWSKFPISPIDLDGFFVGILVSSFKKISV